MRTKTNNWTLISALEEIWRKADDCELSEEYFKNIELPAKYVQGLIGINPVQCFIVAVLIDSGEPLAPRQIENIQNRSSRKAIGFGC